MPWDWRQVDGAPRDRGRLAAASFVRNREPILAVLHDVLPPNGTVLELASGTGEHAAWFARRLPALRWQPTDVRAESLASIAAWRTSAAATNLQEPLRLDVVEPSWPVARVDAVVAINLLQIVPWEGCLRMLARVAAVLPVGAPAVFYGPLTFGGEHVTASNAEFDAALRANDPLSGVRDRDEVARAAAERQLAHEETRPLPNNNFAIVLRRRG